MAAGQRIPAIGMNMMRTARQLSYRVVWGCAAAFCVALWAAPSSAITPKPIADLAPHRAVYEMTLGDSRSGSTVSGLRGRMVFEFSGNECDGYTVNMRLVTRITDRSGRAMVSDLRSSTWEGGDAEKFRFNSSQYVNQQLNEAARGSASRDEGGKQIVVSVEKPKEEKLELPGSVMFPAQHARAILQAAMKGRQVLNAELYEGSDKGVKVYRTTAFIGKELPPGADKKLEKVENGDVLEKLQSWPISVGYYDDNGAAEEMPSYELGYRYYANGVSRRLTIDYGDFSIQGELRSIEFLNQDACKR